MHADKVILQYKYRKPDTTTVTPRPIRVYQVHAAQPNVLVMVAGLDKNRVYLCCCKPVRNTQSITDSVQMFASNVPNYPDVHPTSTWLTHSLNLKKNTSSNRLWCSPATPVHEKRCTMRQPLGDTPNSLWSCN